MILQSLKNEALCHVYAIDGPGLTNQGGEIWFNASTSILEGFKIRLPDEDSYQNVLFNYSRTESMNITEWEEFKKSKWNR